MIQGSIIETIKEWIHYDNEISALQKELNIKKSEKKRKTEEIIEAMKTHDIDCFAVKDGSIQYKKKCVKKPLSQGYLLKLLMEYHQGDELKAQELNDFLKENREEVIRENIIHKK
jgi:glycosylphosphatidylinositol transamidase (GPIT) subunit GPI8